MKVSVSVITYNHRPYIARALDGILMQDVDFDFEIVVGDDCSTDGTREIVGEYHARYPQLIRPILPEQNLGYGGKRILAQTLELCRGEFIARMDGDDYWTSPDKLRNQVGFLERHRDCSMCYHNVLVAYDDESREPHPFVPSDQPAFSDAVELFAGCFVPSPSPLFRRDALLPLPSWYLNLPTGDWSLYLVAGEKGKIGYLDEVMGVYRVHSGGMWSGLDETRQLEMIAEKFEAFSAATEGAYADEVAKALSDTYLRLAAERTRLRDHRGAQRYAWAALRRNPRGNGLKRKRLLTYLLKPYGRALSGLLSRLTARSEGPA